MLVDARKWGDIMHPTISIIMPVYNCQDYVSEAIESVIKQSWKQWEMIIVDDGSNDKSGEICDKYAENDLRIRVLHCNNGGVSEARNRGILEASGEFIQFIDGDDKLKEDAMEIIIKEMELENQEIDLIIFGYETFPKQIVKSIVRKMKIDSKDAIAENFDLLFPNHLLHSPCNKLYKRSIISQNHLVFPLDMSMGEDLMFNLAYIKCINRACVIPEVLYDYRRNISNSLTSTFRKDMVETQFRLKKEVDKTFGNHKVVLKQTDKMFAENFFNGLKAVSYQDGLTKYEKKVLIDTWISNPDYLEVYFRSNLARKGMLMNYMIKTKKIDLMIFLFKIRKVLASILHLLK